MYEAPVIRRFRCKIYKRRFSPGETYRHESAERMDYLASFDPPYIAWPPKPEPEVAGEPRHVGGGWYELPDGRRVRGRDAAVAALRGDGHGPAR